LKLSYRSRITILTILAVIVPVFLIQIMSLVLQSRIAVSAEKELLEVAETNIEQIARDVYSICEAADEMMKVKNDISIRLLKTKINETGGAILTTENVVWQAKNQYSGSIIDISLPKLLIGGLWLGQNSDLNIQTPIIDKVKEIAGGTVTIFQKMDLEGNMLRIATNVPTLDNRRAIGTFIPAKDSNNVSDPIISKVLSGQKYEGIAYVVNDWYITIYEPLKDKSGNIIGMIYVGERLNSIKSLRNSIMNIKVGETGYTFVLGTISPYKGKYLISQKGLRDGDNIYDEKSQSGLKIAKDMINDAMKFNGNETKTYRYNWMNPGETKYRDKIASVAYFKPWGWVIGATTYEEDFLETKDKVHEIIEDIQIKLLLMVGGILIVVLVVASFISKRMTKPLNFITEVANKISLGLLGESKQMIKHYKEKNKLLEVNENVKDESIILMLSFERMIVKLEDLIRKVEESGIKVGQTVFEITAQAKQLEGTISEQASLSSEVSASSMAIADTAQKIADKTEDINLMALETNQIANGGLQKLEEMKGSLDNMVNSSSGIYEKLDIIKNKTKNINNIVTAITKVANQTNLLSLNASIEAERAGEAGSGFAIVAREIRRLADQTSIAALDIEKLIEEMQKAVNQGTEFIITYTDENKNSVQKVALIIHEIRGLIEKMGELPVEIYEYKLGMDEQSQSASQISLSMSELTKATQQTRDSAIGFNLAAKDLKESIDNLRVEINKFQLKGTE